MANEKKDVKDNNINNNNNNNKSNISSSKKNDKDDPCIVLVSGDPKFSYMFGMTIGISGYDKLSIYDLQSNWLSEVLFLKGSESKLVFIDTENMDFDRFIQLFKKIIRRRKDDFIDDNPFGNGPQIRFCFLVEPGSVQATCLLELRNEMLLDSIAAGANQYEDIIEKPFTIAEVVNTLSSELLCLHTHTHAHAYIQTKGRKEK